MATLKSAGIKTATATSKNEVPIFDISGRGTPSGQLKPGRTYYVVGAGSVTYNDRVYRTGDKFVALEDITTYSTTGTPRVVTAYIADYNTQDRVSKDAAAQLKELRPDVEPVALKKLIEHNLANPLAPTDSVKLRDENGQMVRLSFTSKYKFANAEQASAIFEAHGLDINEFAQETTNVAVDDKFFLDKEGNFDSTLYNDFKVLVDDFAKKKNKTSPISSTLVVQPKPNFHALRWVKDAFKKVCAVAENAAPSKDREVLENTCELQEQLCQALPNTVQLVANVK